MPATNRPSEAGAGARWAVRRVAVGATVAVLLVTGTLVGYAVRQAGCGQGREAVIAHLVPIGGARATFSEDEIKDLCHARYTTTAPPADVFDHHGAQLTSQGWKVTPSDPTTFPPYLKARRGGLSVYVSVDRSDGENIVQLLASRVG
ncbi:MAG: hypothetical protein M3Q71_04235 [Chloroflexota bacterium]|nr:hypothetical protein [Chloroflexota bacterium]MDP9469864.1 hypothetical protein [Chloroflexota bacterium]